MLHIYIEGLNEYEFIRDNYVGNVSDVFDNEYEDAWITDVFTKRVISIIDKSEVVDANTLISRYGGSLPITCLSNGVKSLILLKFTDRHVNGDRMGDNCVPILLQLAKEKDIYISLGHLMDFPYDLNAIIDNNGKEINNVRDFIEWYGRLSCR